MRLALPLLLLAAGAAAQGRGNRKANEESLGLVVFEKKGKVVVHEALEGGPAAKAGVKKGDVVLKVGPKEIERHNDVDAALASWPKDKEIELDLVRDGRKRNILVQPKAGLRHPYLRPAPERTGFDAPPWHAFAWVNAGKEPPTRANTKGKVVVIHCFQSW